MILPQLSARLGLRQGQGLLLQRMSQGLARIDQPRRLVSESATRGKTGNLQQSRPSVLTEAVICPRTRFISTR